MPAAGSSVPEPGLLAALRARWRLLVLAPLAAGAVSLGVTALIPPTFTAAVVFMPPQPAQGNAGAALAALGSLASLTGMSAGVRTSADQYVALLQSTTISDRIIDQFQLSQVYERELRTDTRKDLRRKVRVTLGKKDGLITVEVDDRQPERAARMANQYVDELRKLTSNLAMTEAQQRRAFFETQLKQTRDRLQSAQSQLQRSGFSPGALKTEPRTAAEGFARLKAEVTSAEVRLQVIRRTLMDDAPEVRQQMAALEALRQQLAQLVANTASPAAPNDDDYVSRYREFKYQETLFELYARQFELARVDESREGALIQVIDPAQPPERKSKPQHARIAAMAAALTLLALSAWVLVRHSSSLPPSDDDIA